MTCTTTSPKSSTSQPPLHAVCVFKFKTPEPCRRCGYLKLSDGNSDHVSICTRSRWELCQANYHQHERTVCRQQPLSPKDVHTPLTAAQEAATRVFLERKEIAKQIRCTAVQQPKQLQQDSPARTLMRPRPVPNSLCFLFHSG